ncbi:MAG: glycoside hydrolase [Ruminococcaceae bacterium]|nr:glycoside hydrolase [Oscillospiraceae bacterium]
MKNGSIHYGDDIKRDGPVLTPWEAKWIWDTENTAMHNWLCLREKINLENLPASAIARVAVDSRYWLWVNGKAVIEDGQIKRGPTENDTYFEYVDLTAYLKKGENTFAVLTVYYGNDSKYFNYHPSGKGAFVMEADLGESLLKTDESWKVKKHAAFLNRQELLGEGPSSRIPEEDNYYDARLALDLENWQQADYDDSSWEQATVYGNVGDAPWNQLWERSIPQMKYWPRQAYTNPEVYEAYRSNATAQTVSLGMKLPYNMQMQPYLKVEAPAGLEIKMLSDGTESLNTYYVTKGGVQEFEGFYWMSAQTLTYVVPAGVKILDLGYRQSGYDCEFAGSFHCEDEDYNILWKKSMYTLYITMRDTYMDCPDRERGQWWGDCTNESLMSFYALSKDANLLYRKGVDSIINWRKTDPGANDKCHVLQTVVPINNHYIELPLQQLAGVYGFWTYFMHTGEMDFARQVYQPAMDYLKRWVLGERGLVAHRISSWDWPDWGDDYDVPVMENAWYYMALHAVRNFAEVLGETKDLPLLDKRMNAIKKAFREVFWTGSAYYAPQECYVDNGYEYKFDRPAQPDDRANALAVLSGLADKSQYPAILEILKKQFNSSPYMEKYVEDAMFFMGYENEALERMKTRYRMMIDDEWTTLWENFKTSASTRWGTHNHAWTGGPLVGLSGNVAGVAPDAPGYAQYHIIPQLGGLKDVAVCVPSVKGDIKVQIYRDVEKQEVKITLESPANTVARVAIPKFDGKDLTVSVETGDQNVAYESQDEQYVYYLAQPGHHCFVGK